MKLLKTLLFIGSAAFLSASEKDFLENPPYAYNGISIGRTAETERTPDGEGAFEVSVRYGSADLAWSSQLRNNIPAEKIRGVERGELEFWAKGPAGRSMRLGLNSEDFSGDETIRYTDTATFPMTGKWQKIVWRFQIAKPVVGHYADAPRYALLNTQAGDKFLLGPVALKVLSWKDFPVPQPEVPAGWRALPESGLYIEPGSALDFRRIFDRRPAGSLGRVIVNRAGKLAFEKEPEKEVRFFSVQGFPDMMTKPELKEYAAAVARQGFNMIRLHFLDAYLNFQKKEAPWLKKGVNKPVDLPQDASEIRFSPIALDRIFYLIACLKAEGVYVNLDLQCSFYGYRNGTAPSGYPKDAENAKIQMFISEKFRKNYAAGTKKLLNTVNPYTGLALKDEPAVAMLCFYNEQDILLDHRNYGKEFHPAYVRFLKDKYGTPEAMNKAWKTNFPSFEAVSKFGSLPRGDRSAQTAAMTEFAAKMQADMDDFYRRVVAECGWRGLSSNWNMRPYLCSVPARSKLDLVMLNSYHAHPEFRGGETVVSQRSSLASGGNSFSHSTTVRFLDRPFVVSEYGHVYWNRYRHEEGLLWGAGAAFQGWSGLTPHANNVVKYMKKLEPFAVGVDPITRATEQIAMLAFLRGDIREASAAIEYEMKPEFLFSYHLNTGLSSEYYQLWPLVKLGVSFDGKHRSVDPALRLVPSRTGAVGGGLLYTENETSSRRDISEAIVADLRRKGVLSSANRTDVSRGRFESCTGEIFLTKERGGEMTVSTPRLCGIVKKTDGVGKAGALTVLKNSVPVAVATASLDERALPESRRILLFVLTDARSSNMKFLDREETRIKYAAKGSLPVLIKTGVFKIALDRSGGKMKCYALDLSGKRVGEIPVKQETGRLVLELDTAKTPIPATSYELVAAD